MQYCKRPVKSPEESEYLEMYGNTVRHNFADDTYELWLNGKRIVQNSRGNMLVFLQQLQAGPGVVH